MRSTGSIPYKIGVWVARNPLLAIVALLIFVVAIYRLNTHEPAPSPKAAPIVATMPARPTTPDPRDELCGPGIDQLVAAAKVDMAKKQFQSAYDSLERCSGRMKAGTEAHSTHLKAAEGVIKIREAETAAYERKEKARKKKEGVRIGMTQQDVLDSSWGKPQKVNRTTSNYGIREQWVYGGGYLYFEDGILTTIQN